MECALCEAEADSEAGILRDGFRAGVANISNAHPKEECDLLEAAVFGAKVNKVSADEVGEAVNSIVVFHEADAAVFKDAAEAPNLARSSVLNLSVPNFNAALG